MYAVIPAMRCRQIEQYLSNACKTNLTLSFIKSSVLFHLYTFSGTNIDFGQIPKFTRQMETAVLDRIRRKIYFEISKF